MKLNQTDFETEYEKGTERDTRGMVVAAYCQIRSNTKAQGVLLGYFCDTGANGRAGEGF